MARKHFDDYYNKVYKQLYSLEQVFNDMTEELKNNMIEPERVEQLKKTIEPIKNSYHTLSYIKYLLDKPTKKQKHKRYDIQNKKLLEFTEGSHMEDVLSRNDSILESLKV